MNNNQIQFGLLITIIGLVAIFGIISLSDGPGAAAQYYVVQKETTVLGASTFELTVGCNSTLDIAVGGGYLVVPPTPLDVNGVLITQSSPVSTGQSLWTIQGTNYGDDTVTVYAITKCLNSSS